MTGLVTLVSHLGWEEISPSDLITLTHNSEDDAQQLHANAWLTNANPVNALQPAVSKASDRANSINPIPPPAKPKTALKARKFFLISTNTTPSQQQDNMDAIEDDDEPGIYSTMLDEVWDSTHFITTCFVKSNNKIALPSLGRARGDCH
jgi:hypothetical protein